MKERVHMQAEHYTQDYFEILDSIVDTSTTRGKRVYNNSKDSHINWKKVHVEMLRLFPELTLSSEGLRSQYRRRHDISLKQNDKARHDKNSGRASLEERLIFELKRKRTLTELVDTLAEDEDAIMAGAARLQLAGYTGVRVWQEEGKIYLQNLNKPLVGRETVDMSELYDGDVIQFAVVSDTHMGSTFEALQPLKDFYAYCVNLGITTFFHVGDISEGYYNNRPTSIMDTHKVGYTEQLNWIVDQYPYYEGVETHFITGNHDATHFRNGFADIGDGIARLRPDMIYLGHNFAKVSITPNLTMSLVHPTDGISQSLSLKLQHLIDRNVNRRSDIMLVGHYHKSVNIKYNGVYGYIMPSFEYKTPFMDDNNIVSDVAGTIFTIRVDKEGRLLSIGTEYVSYND